MKVKVVCACSVSLGRLFFHQQGEKVAFLLRRDALFGKSRLVSFNEVSKGPDDVFKFRAVLRLCIYRGRETAHVLLVWRSQRAACEHVLIRHIFMTEPSVRCTDLMCSCVWTTPKLDTSVK